ncbi:iron-sulfur cluster repair di-iron protein [Bacillus spongiae]|uniref:Iron-sulfur cluster repair di-iron protein n=1 Tax=Bacillus spongiae TaxID=2683610 RepID=A0ABU8HFR3_9BACI
MEQVFTETLTVAEIVKRFPRASDLFKSYQINFCCGGNKSLIEATEEKNISLDVVLSNLNKLYHETNALKESTIDWEHASSSTIINHIIAKHHHYLNEELPLLTPYVTKVSRVHGETNPHLMTVNKLFQELKIMLEQHIAKEEQDDFPALLAFEKQPTLEHREKIMKVIQELENEHISTVNLLKEMRTITNDFTPPEGACGTYRLVYQRLEALETDIYQHIHLENNILFPRVAA